MKKVDFIGISPGPVPIVIESRRSAQNDPTV